MRRPIGAPPASVSLCPLPGVLRRCTPASGPRQHPPWRYSRTMIAACATEGRETTLNVERLPFWNNRIDPHGTRGVLARGSATGCRARHVFGIALPRNGRNLAWWCFLVALTVCTGLSGPAADAAPNLRPAKPALDCAMHAPVHGCVSGRCEDVGGRRFRKRRPFSLRCSAPHAPLRCPTQSRERIVPGPGQPAAEPSSGRPTARTAAELPVQAPGLHDLSQRRVYSVVRPLFACLARAFACAHACLHCGASNVGLRTWLYSPFSQPGPRLENFV